MRAGRRWLLTINAALAQAAGNPVTGAVGFQESAKSTMQLSRGLASASGSTAASWRRTRPPPRAAAPAAVPAWGRPVAQRRASASHAAAAAQAKAAEAAQAAYDADAIQARAGAARARARSSVPWPPPAWGLLTAPRRVSGTHFRPNRTWVAPWLRRGRGPPAAPPNPRRSCKTA
jgi:hypothetical protein